MNPAAAVVLALLQLTQTQHSIVTPRVAIARLMVSDASMQVATRRVLLRNLARVVFCYEQGLLTSADLHGRVTVAFEVAGDGTVPSAAPVRARPPMLSVAQCIARATQTLMFVSTGASWHVEVEFTLSNPTEPRRHRLNDGR